MLNCKVNTDTSTTCMIDSGASSQFMDHAFAVDNGFKLVLKSVPETLTVVDGRPSAAGLLTHEVHASLLIDQHLERLVFQVTQLASYPLILGKSWLRYHNPVIDWAKNTVLFGSGHCQAHCLPVRTPEPVLAARPAPTKSHRIALISASGFCAAAKEPDSILFVANI